MIAAPRRRIGAVFAKLTSKPARWSRAVDRASNRGLERAYPALLRSRHFTRTHSKRAVTWAGPRVRPVAARFFRVLAAAEHRLRAGGAALARWATRLSTGLTPRRAIAAAIVVAGACLVVSQFLDYRAVEIGQQGYAGLDSIARPPTVDSKTAGDAHAYLLVPVGALAIALGVLGVGRDRRRLGLGVAGLGLLAIAAILLVDLPVGLDAGSQTSRFAGATAVLEDGFYAELAAASGLVLAGLLYYARPCRIRTNSSGRAASARRRRPRRRASSPARVARRA
jgi:hypothetical protein